MGILNIILGLISTAITPALRAFLKDALQKWEVEAKKTPSEIDDFIVNLIKIMVGV